MRIAIFLTLQPIVFLAGCAETSSRGDSSLQRDASISNFVRESPQNESASRQAAAIRDLTLEQAIEIAERGHPELALAGAGVEGAAGRAEQAGLYPNPRAVIRVESAPFEGSTTGDAEYVAGFSVPVLPGGRFASARRAGELERSRRVEDAEAKRLEICARVQGAFAAVLYLEEATRAQADSLRLSENGVRTAVSLFDAGDGIPEDVARAELEQVRARLDLEKVRSFREQALTALSAAMGDTGIQIETVKGSLEASLEIPTLEALSSRLAEHPLLRSAEADIAVQRARLDVAEAQRIPDVNLDLFFRRLEHSETNSFDVGASIALPIFDRNQGRLREARADIVAAGERARAVETDLSQQLRESHAQLLRALAATRVLKEEVLPRAETILRGGEARYSSGDIALSEVLVFRKDRIAVQLAYLESLRDVMQAWASLSVYVRRA